MSDFVKKIKSGQAAILGSGVFITFDNQPVEVEFGTHEGTSDSLKIIFEFKNTDDEKPDIKSEIVEKEKVLKLILINFKNEVIGTGTLRPIEIGTYGGKKLSIGFRVEHFRDGQQRTFHYSFYQHE